MMQQQLRERMAAPGPKKILACDGGGIDIEADEMVVGGIMPDLGGGD